MSVVRMEKLGQIALVTLNRPEVHNAISPEMACRLEELYSEIDSDPGIAVMVVTGSGDKAFCSGGDLDKSLPLLTGARAPEDEWDRQILKDPAIFARAALRMDFSKPVVTAVNGACLAGGLELVLGTDIRIAAEHAIFGLPEVRHALIPFAGALSSLQREVPACVAMELLLLGTSISASEALRLGLLNQVLPRNEVLAKALEMANRIAANGPLAVREIKRVVRSTVGATFQESCRIEDEARNLIMATADAKEGPLAFRQRRKPVFEGR